MLIQTVWTYIFYFDGAPNMQKASDVLEVQFSRTVTYHGGKYAVALWFLDLAKIPGIKVCFFMFQFLFVLDLCNKDPPSFLETSFEGVPLL